jgi:hypothetical protein
MCAVGGKGRFGGGASLSLSQVPCWDLVRGILGGLFCRLNEVGGGYLFWCCGGSGRGLLGQWSVCGGRVKGVGAWRPLTAMEN